MRRRGCHVDIGCAERVDFDGDLDDIAVRTQLDFLCTNDRAEAESRECGRRGFTKGIYVFHGREAECTVVKGTAGLAGV